MSENKMEEVRAAMLALGFTEGGKPTPWCEALGYSDEELPGVSWPVRGAGRA